MALGDVDENRFQTDRDFMANRFDVKDQKLWDQYQYKTNMDYGINRDQYGDLNDQYNRNIGQKALNYGMIGDLANIGQQARQRLAGTTSGYFDTLSDLSLQRGNAAAAAQQQKLANTGLLKNIGL